MATHVYMPRSQPSGLGWCGPVCIANALAIYGIPTTQEECAGACQTPSDEGSDKKDIHKGLKKFGFRANIKDVREKSKFSQTLRWVKNQTDNGKFVICSINGHYEAGHWILILGVSSRGIQVWDPHDEGSKLISRKNLFKAWWNVTSSKDPIPDPPSQVLLIAMSPRAKLARRAVEVRRNLINPPNGELPVDKAIPETFDDEPEQEETTE